MQPSAAKARTAARLSGTCGAACRRYHRLMPMAACEDPGRRHSMPRFLHVCVCASMSGVLTCRWLRHDEDIRARPLAGGWAVLVSTTLDAREVPPGQGTFPPVAQIPFRLRGVGLSTPRTPLSYLTVISYGGLLQYCSLRRCRCARRVRHQCERSAGRGARTRVHVVESLRRRRPLTDGGRRGDRTWPRRPGRPSRRQHGRSALLPHLARARLRVQRSQLLLGGVPRHAVGDRRTLRGPCQVIGHGASHPPGDGVRVVRRLGRLPGHRIADGRRATSRAVSARR